jgi:hypothetical protein
MVTVILGDDEDELFVDEELFDGELVPVALAEVEPRPDHDIIAARASTVSIASTGLRQAVHLCKRLKEVNFDIIGPLGMSLIA